MMNHDPKDIRTRTTRVARLTMFPFTQSGIRPYGFPVAVATAAVVAAGSMIFLFYIIPARRTWRTNCYLKLILMTKDAVGGSVPAVKHKLHRQRSTARHRLAFQSRRFEAHGLADLDCGRIE